MSFEFVKTDSQLLKTGLQTLPPIFLETRFYMLLLETSFYRNSMDPNRA
jgi:hypothetical protein